MSKARPSKSAGPGGAKNRPARRPAAESRGAKPRLAPATGPDAEGDREFEDLLALARDKSTEGRGRLVDILSDLFVGGDKALNERERGLMTEILRRLIHDVEKDVRQKLANRLATVQDAPRALVFTLANDEIEVAHPVLMHSAALRDLELVEVIQHQSMQHHLAIAARRGLSEEVTDALVGAGDAEVVQAVLQNLDARLSSNTLETLVEESESIQAYQEPLVRRGELSPRLAKKMYWWVSAALREHISQNFDIDSTELDNTIVGAVNEMIGEDEANAQARASIDGIVGNVSSDKDISADMLVKALRRGHIALFEALFARKVNLRKQLVKRFIFETGGEGLAIACKAADIGKADFASIFLLSRSARPGEKQVAADELSRAITFFNKLKPDVAKKVVERWHLDPDYLHALRDVEGDSE